MVHGSRHRLPPCPLPARPWPQMDKSGAAASGGRAGELLSLLLHKPGQMPLASSLRDPCPACEPILDLHCPFWSSGQ